MQRSGDREGIEAPARTLLGVSRKGLLNEQPEALVAHTTVCLGWQSIAGAAQRSTYLEPVMRRECIALQRVERGRRASQIDVCIYFAREGRCTQRSRRHPH